MKTAEELEQYALEQEESAETLTIQRYAFNSFRIERSIRDILNWVDKGKIIIPEFQRDFVWNYNQSSRFIESILLGLPIPDFFMFRIIDSKEKVEKFILIDGLQRYTTIRQYVTGYFEQGTTKKVFKINNKSSQWYSSTYDKLDENDKDFFNDYSLKINVFDSMEDSDRIQKLYMTAIFERINTGSSKLSNQEVRNAIYTGDVIRKIKDSIISESFTILLADDQKNYSQRCKNQEFYLRLLTYYHVYLQLCKGSHFFVDSDIDSKISSSKDLMLCNFLYYCNNNSINFLNYNEKLLRTLTFIVKFTPNAFCTVKRDEDKISNKIHEVFSEALTIALMDGAEINISKQQFDLKKIMLWRNQEKYVEFFHNTTSLENIKKRVSIIKQILAGEL